MAYSNQHETVLDYIEEKKGKVVRYVVAVLLVLGVFAGMIMGFALATIIFIQS